MVDVNTQSHTGRPEGGVWRTQDTAGVMQRFGEEAIGAEGRDCGGDRDGRETLALATRKDHCDQSALES